MSASQPSQDQVSGDGRTRSSIFPRRMPPPWWKRLSVRLALLTVLLASIWGSYKLLFHFKGDGIVRTDADAERPEARLLQLRWRTSVGQGSGFGSFMVNREKRAIYIVPESERVLCVLDLDTGKLRLRFTPDGRKVDWAYASAAGDRIVMQTSGADGVEPRVSIVNAGDYKVIGSFALQAAGETARFVDDAGTKLVLLESSKDPRARVYDVASGKVISTYTPLTGQ
jgi:hypothetical protein